MVWTWDKVDYLYKHYHSDRPEDICKALGVSVSSMLNEVGKLFLREKGAFTCEEKSIIQEHGESLQGAVMFLMEDRTSEECAQEVLRVYP